MVYLDCIVLFFRYMKNPTFKQLRYFLALCEERHFGRAAKRSFVSQSAFSNAIRELEDALSTQLVDRTNRNVTITANGRRVNSRRPFVKPELSVLLEDVRRRGDRQHPFWAKVEM